MHKLARQKHILDRLSETGQLSISELVAELQVSADTIRRDLSDLEQQGVLQKSHGGAIALNVPAMTRQGRNALLTQTKQRLGQQVAARIPSGSTLFLDAGSTLLAVAAQLERAVNRDHGFSGYRSAVQRPCRYPADPAWRPVG